MWQKFKSSVKLSPAQWKQLLEAWLLFIIWDRRLQKKAYESWRKNISNATTNGPGSASLSEVLAIIRIIEIAGRHHFVKVNCLRRCLTQKQMLTKRQVPVTIHFGVKLTAGRIDAHCWLVWNGIVINDSPEVVESYSELKEITAPSLSALLASPH
ncbi:lasso peptide biosynthesis B2 protein [Reinekea marinisedimentorum]|uniref:Transglutaminase superfamily protein n=1 Tax=Reinekea marinisedimentorum TaxID=230495 RepID=A0A4R3HV88_9GAMM|nr:lasso peptide biosynthesis B2 protein [Reinekea marinisedimentorum]TCS37157.1 transglutaminase superfamily protein [Reinekea marinisedimentorum]